MALNIIFVCFFSISRVKTSVVNLFELLLSICVILIFLADVNGWYCSQREDFLGNVEKLARGTE
jgi:presenilin-like A22 family membrane protease